MSIVALLYSCKKETIDMNYSMSINTDNDLIEEYDILAFDAQVIHVIHREYLISNPNKVLKSDLVGDTNYINHLENRLITMYPTEAYVGMIEDNDSVLFNLLSNAPTYVDTLEFTESDTIPTLNMEADILAMDSTDSFLWNQYEDLASGFSTGHPATYEDIMNINQSGKTAGIFGLVLKFPVASASAVVGVAWISWRAIQCKNRAEDKAEEFYPNLYSGDTKRDAFRHITWQMLTRRYCGKTTAWILGGIKESSLMSNNTCTAKQMDLHNNLIGRAKKYSDFRDFWGTSPWQWKKWCTNIKNYINAPTTNAIHVEGDWTEQTGNTTYDIIETCTNIETDRKSVFNKYKYIYILK